MIRTFSLAALASCAWSVMAQPGTGKEEAHVEILNADRWNFNEDLATGAQRLLGHVRFRHADAIMYCDSAWLYDDQRVKAFGHVELRQGDTLRITGDKLLFSGKEHTARMEGNVRLTEPGMELTTDALTYNVRTRRAEYGHGAHITDRDNGSTLSSKRGAFLADRHLFIFSDSVRIVHPESIITADSLHYSTASGMAWFYGPTHIVQDSIRIYGERGSYDTRSGRGWFTQAARITGQGRVLTGDSLYYDRAKGEGTGWGHVTIKDTANNLLVRGEYGIHRQADHRSMVTGHAELVMLMGEDSLFLHADTLFARQDSLEQRQIIARRNVRFFKSDMQGVCDTMIYNGADSLITLRGDPFIWSKGNQLSGDTIFIQLHNGHAKQLLVSGAALMIDQVDSIHFNQVAGTTLTGLFRQDEIRKLIAEGNSRTIYFTEEKKDSTERITGVNRADCSRITVGLDSGEISTVSFITQPEGVLYPLEKAPKEELRFEGFLWNAQARPADRKDIFRDTDNRQPTTDN